MTQEWASRSPLFMLPRLFVSTWPSAQFIHANRLKCSVALIVIYTVGILSFCPLPQSVLFHVIFLSDLLCIVTQHVSYAFRILEHEESAADTVTDETKVYGWQYCSLHPGKTADTRVLQFTTTTYFMADDQWERLQKTD